MSGYGFGNGICFFVVLNCFNRAFLAAKRIKNASKTMIFQYQLFPVRSTNMRKPPYLAVFLVFLAQYLVL